jgi:fructose-bisphosphate aldolase, class II
MKQCIAAGMSKINVNKLVLDDYYEDLHISTGKVPHTLLMEQGVKKVVDLTMEWMEICGSAGKV